MGNEKGSRVFFEVYRKQMKEEPLPEQKPPSATDVIARSESDEAISRGKVEVATNADDFAPRGTSHEARATRQEAWQQRLGLKRDEVYIRQDTLIYAALGAVFLSLGCFFIGHKLGYDKGCKTELINVKPAKQDSVGSTKENALQPTAKKAEEAQDAVPVAASQTPQTIQCQPPVSGGSKEEKWTLRIISYKTGDQNTKKASELARTIQKEIGHDAFVAKTSHELVVCVGKFDNRDNSELLALQKELKDFKYDNKKQFKSCYPVRLR